MDDRKPAANATDDNKSVTSSGDSSVEIVEEDVLTKIEERTIYKTSYEIFDGRKYNSPNNAAMKKALMDCLSGDGSTLGFASNSVHMKQYQAIKKVVMSGTPTARSKRCTQPFLAKHLSYLMYLHGYSAKLLKDKPSDPPSNRTRGARKPSEEEQKKMKMQKKEKKSFDALSALFQPCYASYKAAKEKEMNTLARTPSLQLNQTGTRLQDNVPFDASKKDAFGCPICGGPTMCVESNAQVNATNEANRANSTDGKFTGKSSKHGCYSYSQDCCGNDDGRGCIICEEKVRKGEQPQADVVPVGHCKFGCKACASDCCAIFDEHQRQRIALGWQKNKQRAEANSGGGNNGSGGGGGGGNTAKFMDLLAGHMANNYVREAQNNDDRSIMEFGQDVVSHTAIDILEDPAIQGNLAMRRELQSVISRTTNVNFNTGNGKAAMSISKARNEQRKKRKTTNVPPGSTFISNKSNSYAPPQPDQPIIPNANNRAHRNRLSPHSMNPSGYGNSMGMMGGGHPPQWQGPGYADPFAAATASRDIESPDLVQRTRSRATKVWLSDDSSPGTAADANNVRKKLARSDPELTALIEDTKPADSQDAYALCVKSNKSEEGN